MNSKEFRAPLIQSAALIVIVLLFISFVISSGADDLKGGLQAVFSGISHSIVLCIGLLLSILLSIVLLIALFLAGTAVYSRDKAKEIGMQIYRTTLHLAHSARDTFAHAMQQREGQYTSQASKIRQLEETVAQLSIENRQLKATMASFNRHTAAPAEAVSSCSREQSSSNSADQQVDASGT